MAAALACTPRKTIGHHVPAFLAILLHQVNEYGVLLRILKQSKVLLLSQQYPVGCQA